MRIADIRSAIDSAAWCVRDFQGHTREEFARADVPGSLGRHIAALQALDIAERFAQDRERRDYQIGACQRMIARWHETRCITGPAGNEPVCTTVYIVPAWSDQAGQCRIVARNAFIADPRLDYQENPGRWHEIGLMSSSGEIRCLTAPVPVYNELRASEPLAAGNVFRFQP